jgi:peroxiredoxin
MTTRSGSIEVGAVVKPHELRTIDDETVQVPDPERLVHLQFRRFAGCPFCNLHLRSIEQRHDEIAGAGIREVVVFHSSAEALRSYAPDHSFAIIPDPEKRLYAEFGVHSSLRSQLDPRAWGPAVRGLLAKRSLKQSMRGGINGLPGDFLIAPDGEVIARKYGEHAFDQWSVDELLAAAPQRVA